MRVTHVITRLIVGGAQENTVATVLGLNSLPGIKANLIAGTAAGPEGSLASSFDHCPQTLLRLGSLVRPVNPILDTIALLRLTRLFRHARPDIVHTHSGKAGILGRWAAHRAGVPIVIHTIHGPSFGKFQGKIANATFLGAERFAAKFTTHFVTVADAMSRQYLAAGIGNPAKFTRIFSGFPLGPFLSAQNDPAFRQRLGITPNDIVIGMISRLFKLKGHDDLLDVAPIVVREFPAVKFLLVGDGQWRGRLQNRVRAMGLQNNFIFAGLVSPAEIPNYIGIMDALTHLSYREGLPRALPQALAAGRPVAAYDCDGAAEVCMENKTGFLIPPGDRETLSRRLLQLAHDKDLRLRLGQTGRKFVRERFLVETMVADTHALYQKLSRSGNNAAGAK